MRSRMLLLGGQAAALGGMIAFLLVPASALFLHAYGARSLPYAYLAVAPAGVLVSTWMTRAGRRLALGRLLVLLVSVYLAAVVLGWLVLVGWNATWVTFPLLVLYPLSIPVGFVAIGAQAVRLYDVRRLKAEFPRIVAGFSLGFAVGGLAAAALARPLGSVEHLLAADALAALAMLLLVRTTARRFPAELLTPPERLTGGAGSAPVGGGTGRPGDRPPWWAGLRDPLVVVVGAYMMLMTGVNQLIDYVVWERAAAYYPDPAALAQFQGVFGAALNVVSVVFVTAAAAWLLKRYGIRLGLAANPAAVLVLIGAMLVLGQAGGPAGFVFLAAACTTQIVDISLTDGLTRTSVAATYQAMPRQQRLRAQAMIEGAGSPVAVGLAGALLLAKEALHLDVLAVVWLILGLAALWLGLAVVAHRRYGEDLADVLVERSWDPTALRIADPAAYAAVHELLESGDLRDRATGLEALADSGSPNLPDEVVRALGDRDPKTQLVALETVGRVGIARDPAVRDALCATLGGGSGPALVVAAAALVTAPEPHGERAREIWTGAVDGDDEELVAAALVGAANTPDAFFLPTLVDLAGRPQPPPELAAALSVHTHELEPVLEQLWDVGESGSPEDRRRRSTIIHSAAGSPDEHGRDWLLERLRDPRTRRDDVIRIADCLAPASADRVPSSVAGSAVAAPIQREAARAARVLGGLELLDPVLPGSPPVASSTAGVDGAEATADLPALPDLDVEVIRGALRDELESSQGLVERFMGLAAAPHGTAWVLSALGSADEGQRATAAELLEVALGGRLGRVVVAVLDPGLDDAARRAALSRLQAATPITGSDLPTWLTLLARDPDRAWDDPWLRACALRVLPRIAPGEARASATALASDPDPVVAETAGWVLAHTT